MTILCTIDLETREVSIPSGQCIAAYDHNVDVIRFQAETIPGFSLDTSTIRIAAQGPNRARHDYAVDPSTVAIEEETGYITFDWPIPQGVTEMPLDAGFKYGDRGQLIFAVCAEIIDGSTVSKAWHSDDGIITVVAHLEPESGGGEDPEEEATNAQKIGQLQTATAILQREISGIASGTPPTASSTSEMDPDESTVYINTTDGNWYYYNGTAWTSGGVYGGAVTDTTLSISGAAADSKAVGDAISNITIEVDDTLSEQGKAADAKATGDAVANLNGRLTQQGTSIGDLSQLNTEEKSNLVAAINEAAQVDDTLTISGAAADAKATGDEVADLKSTVSDINSIISTEIEIAWIQGSYNRKNGNYGNNNRDACSDGFLPDGIQTLVVPSEYGSRLFAWDTTTGQYVGAQIEGGTFATSGTAVYYDTQDIAALNQTYPNYAYKVTVIRDNYTVIDVSTESPLFKAYDVNVVTKEEVNEIKGAVFDTKKNIEWVSGIGNHGTFYSNANDKTSKPFPLYKGETVKVTTKGDGQFMFYCIAKVENKNMPIARRFNGGVSIHTITSNSLTMYSYTATEDEYIIITVYDDGTSSVEFDGLNRMDTLDKEIHQAMDIKNYILKDKTVFFFGDSLTSAATSGLIGFAKIMAENSDTPYEIFRMDSADGNVDDVVNPGYPRFANYAKDGTTNRLVSGRTDSVVERVKRHIDANTDVDYVLIECCVNDTPNSSTTKGEISVSYTGPFDTSTSIGSIEETIRYLTTLGTPLKIGFFIPWNVVWVNPTFFDAYIPVFEKWGVPCFDMRKCAGFNMRDCEAHRLAYSLSSDNYAAYDNTAVYNLDDLVKYAGNCYKCKADGVVGILPTDESKWMLVSSESADGTHLNNAGHEVVSGKIQGFVNAL